MCSVTLLSRWMFSSPMYPADCFQWQEFIIGWSIWQHICLPRSPHILGFTPDFFHHLATLSCFAVSQIMLPFEIDGWRCTKHLILTWNYEKFSFHTRQTRGRPFLTTLCCIIGMCHAWLLEQIWNLYNGFCSAWCYWRSKVIISSKRHGRQHTKRIKNTSIVRRNITLFIFEIRRENCSIDWKLCIFFRKRGFKIM